MELNKYFKRFVFASLLISANAFAFSLVDSLHEKKDFKKLIEHINKATVIEDDNHLPDNPKENQLLIIDNEYDVKILYEYNDDEWNEKGSKEIAQILNGGNKTSFHHLFNFQLDKMDFNAYTSDEALIQIEILKSSYKQDAINRTVQTFIKDKSLESDAIINLQIQNIHKESCDIIISYKY